jgi:hypothetical protein
MSTPKFTPIKGNPGWSYSDADGDSYAVEEFAKTLNMRRPDHTYFVCGMLPDDTRHGLYRIETRDTIEIIRAFQVGTHAEISYGVDEHPAVLEQMTKVHAYNPIVPFFADCAGLKCTFERTLTQEFGDFLESTITVGDEIYGASDEGVLGPVVVREGFLHLWWD